MVVVGVAWWRGEGKQWGWGERYGGGWGRLRARVKPMAVVGGQKEHQGQHRWLFHEGSVARVLHAELFCIGVATMPIGGWGGCRHSAHLYISPRHIPASSHTLGVKIAGVSLRSSSISAANPPRCSNACKSSSSSSLWISLLRVGLSPCTHVGEVPRAIQPSVCIAVRVVVARSTPTRLHDGTHSPHLRGHHHPASRSCHSCRSCISPA